MQRLTASLVALLLFTSSLAAAVGQIEICIGDGHVALATADSHHVAFDGCCGHAHSCTDIIVEGISHTTPIVCESTNLNAPTTVAILDLPAVPRRAYHACSTFRPDHPPRIGLIIAQHSVRRL